jgi:photosystem II stability/assembly factor-like uncharacterized protein
MKATLTILLSSLSLIALAQPLIDDAMYMLPLTTNTSRNIIKADFVNANRGCFLMSKGGCMITQNGMLSFTLSNPSGDTSTTYADVATVPGNWLVVTRNGKIYYSSNVGSAWTNVYSNDSIEFTGCDIRAGELIAVGKNGRIIYGTGTSGNFTCTDYSVDSLSGVDFTSVRFGINNIQMGASNGTTYQYNTGSGSVQAFPIAPGEQISTFRFPGSGIGYMVTTGGKIFKTFNSGNTWNLSANFPTYSWNAVDAGDSLVIAVGDSGFIAASLDSGNTFTVYSSGSNNDFYGARYNTGRGYVVGSNGTGLAFSLTDSTLGLKSIARMESCANCIYPNPVINLAKIANPFGQASCTMLLYDMRGREMIRKDLSEINENISLDTLPAGQYLAIFYKGKAVYSQQINVSR